MIDIDLCWRAEEACAAAWPATREIILGQWRVRAAGGPTRRLNSVNPLRGPTYDPRPVMAESEAVYGRLGRAPVYRAPSIATGMDDVLEASGYVASSQTVTSFADLRRRGPVGDGKALRSDRADAAWLNFRNRVTAATPDEARSYADTVSNIITPVCFASVAVDGLVVSAAYGALCRDLLVIESVATDPAMRRQGHGRSVVSALMDWAQSQGVPGACLQVVADNHGARKLYEGLGFDRMLYAYHYRSPPVSV